MNKLQEKVKPSFGLHLSLCLLLCFCVSFLYFLDLFSIRLFEIHTEFGVTGDGFSHKQYIKCLRTQFKHRC